MIAAPATMAATNKSLAQSNKSQDVGKATNEAFGHYSLSSWFRADRAESALANLPQPSTAGAFSVHSHGLGRRAFPSTGVGCTYNEKGSLSWYRTGRRDQRSANVGTPRPPPQQKKLDAN